MPADDRVALRGIGCVLCESVSWRDVPAERGDGPAASATGALPDTGGEIRQQYENACTGCLVGGDPTLNDEADDVRFVQSADRDQYDIRPSVRQQIGDYLAGTYPYLG
ncbi:hypothetical protein ACIO8F_11355 [Streptomyces sp. NPDC087228]|uniref:hypothetical protein n=1 Tax=Streptomyces sp. NPDC087228 TaxID=3365772 RepID=UPI0038258C95